MFVGYLASFPINQILNPEAAAFQEAARRGEPQLIDTQKPEDYNLTQGNIIALGAGVSVLSAQVVFLLGHLQKDYR